MSLTKEMPSTVGVQHSQTEIDAAWRAEIKQRIDDIECGRVQWIDGETYFGELFAELELC